MKFRIQIEKTKKLYDLLMENLSCEFKIKFKHRKVPSKNR